MPRVAQPFTSACNAIPAMAAQPRPKPRAAFLAPISPGSPAVFPASNWLTLSATNGSLTVGAITNVSASINTNANTLVAGSFNDTISFVNTSSGLGNTNRLVTLTVTNLSTSNSFGFFDDFSTFASGNLVGQQSWTQVPSISTLPLTVSGGQVTIPFAQSVDNQDAYKNFTATNGTVFYGLTVTVTNAPNNTAPSYFAGLYTSNNAAGFANYRLTAKDNGGSTCVLGVRITGQTGDPYTFGTGALTYNTLHRVIVEADSGGTVMKLFVDPTSANPAAQTFYASNYIGTGTAPLQVGSFVISQFASGTVPNDGATVGKACVADNFASVYNFLADSLSAFQLWQIQYFGSTNNPSATASADPDGDGENNSIEFLTGTNPTNNASLFRISGVALEGNGVRISWITGSGRTNALQRADDAANGSYSNLATIVTTGSATNYLDAGAATNGPVHFYRVTLVP